MKNNWQIKKLGEVAKIQAGFGFPKNIQGKTSGDFPFIKVGDMNYQRQEIYLGISENYLDQKDLKENGYKIIPAGSIIFPKIGGAIATNKKRILSADSLFDNNVMGIIPTEVVLSEYLYFWLNTKNLSDWASGSALPAINKSTIENEEILLPPLSEQKRIVKILDEKLGKIKEAIKLREEAIADTEKILSRTLSEIFEEGRKKYNKANLDSVAQLVRGPFGGSLKKEIFVTSGIAVYEQGNVIDSMLNDFRYFITDKKFQEMKRFEVSSGDILMSCSGTIGKFVIIPKIYKKGIINQALLKITPKDNVLVEYLKYSLQDYLSKNTNHIKGGAIKNIASVKVLKEFKIPLPEISKQEQIIKKLDSLSEKIKQLKELQTSQLSDLKRLEKSLLREAFNGEL